MTTSDDIIAGLVEAHMGAAPQFYRDDFRQALEILVHLAKAEERLELMQDPDMRRRLN